MVITLLALAPGSAGASAAGPTLTGGAPGSPVRAAAAAASHRYRQATPHERAAINREVDRAKGPFRLRERFAWLIDKRDQQFGVVCGHHHGVSGDAIRHRHHRWRVIRNSSGAAQNAYLICANKGDQR